MALINTLLFVFFSTVICLANDTYFEETGNQVQTKNIGETVRLQCIVHNPHSYSISWVKKEDSAHTLKTLLSIGNKCVANSYRYYVNMYYDKNLYELTITEFEEDDAGTYQCLILLPDSGRLNTDVVLTVNKTPEVVNYP